jgi:hypothetical protein
LKASPVKVRPHLKTQNKTQKGEECGSNGRVLACHTQALSSIPRIERKKKKASYYDRTLIRQKIKITT